MICARVWFWPSSVLASDRDSRESQQPLRGTGTNPGHPNQPKRLPFLLCGRPRTHTPTAAGLSLLCAI